MLWLGQIISQFGDRLTQMALIALIYARAPGSTFQLAKVLSFIILPVFLVGPVAASYVDRWNRRRTMIFCELLKGVLVASIAFFFIKFESPWPIYIVIFLMFSMSRFLVPAKMAIIPELVSREKLLLANSLSSTTGMIGAMVGLGLGGLIAERVGSYGSFLINALAYFVSGFFIFMIVTKAASYFTKGNSATKSLKTERAFQGTPFTDLKEGWRYLTADPHMRFVAKTFFLLWSALGAVYVVIIVFVQRTLGSITRDLGFLAIFLGLGLFFGSLIYGRFGQRLSRMKVIFISLAASGVVLSAFTVFLKLFSSSLLVGALSFILGLTLSPIIISSQTLIHEVAREKMRGRIFGLLEIIAHLAFLLFMFLSSFLAERIGGFWILLFVGVTLTIVGLGTLLLKVDRREGLKYGRV